MSSLSPLPCGTPTSSSSHSEVEWNEFTPLCCKERSPSSPPALPPASEWWSFEWMFRPGWASGATTIHGHSLKQDPHTTCLGMPYIYIYLDLKKGCPVWRSLIVVGWGFQPGDPFEGAGIYAYIDPQSTTPTDRHIWQSQTCRVWESGKRPFKMVICGFEAMPSTELLQP